MAGNAKQTCVVIPPIRSFCRPVRLTASRTRGSSHALTTLRSMFSTPGSASVSSGRVGPHIHGRCGGEHDRDAEDARGAGERDDIVAHLVRREISNARNEPGLVVDKQEYCALRRKALVDAAPAALGLVSRLTLAHSVLLLQKESLLLLPCFLDRRPSSAPDALCNPAATLHCAHHVGPDSA